MKLKSIASPEDLKNLSTEDLKQLAKEIRRFLVYHVSKTGGHLASNLGIVELTLALHQVFDSPNDKIVWDVGHQAYVHKILTGRQEGFRKLRQTGGMSGFPKPEESPHDVFAAGHSSISISAALGLAKARDLSGADHRVVAVIGDGSMTGGIAFEGLNNAGRAGTDILVVLNDNQMSISGNVGALSRHLTDLRTRPLYQGTKESVHYILDHLPVLGEPISRFITKAKDKVKYLIVPGILFEEFGFQYVGPVDGHDLEATISALEKVKPMKGPVLLHVQTVKGKGYPPAEQNPCNFHGVGPFDIKTGTPAPKGPAPCYSEVFGQTLVELAEQNPKILAITAAMTDGTGLLPFSKKYPERFFDVGIAEQHAVTFAAGLAAGGYRPVFAVYSTFLQRAYDQLVHDVCMQNLPVIFAIDRAGVVGADGETHQGVFDLSYLSHIPNMTVLAPKDGAELSAMLAWAVNHPGPVAIRYSKDGAWKREWPMAPVVCGKAEILREGEGIALLAAGDMTAVAATVCDRLEAAGKRPMLINARFIRPMDTDVIREAASKCGVLFTLEDNVDRGGFGSAVAQFIQEEELPIRHHSFAFPDVYIPHGSRKEIFEKYGMDADSIYDSIMRKA